MEAPPGTHITDSYKLPEAQAKRANELLSIRRSAADRLAGLEQKIQDCTRLLEGMWTEIKWERGWDVAAIVGYSEKSGEVVCMEVIRDQKET